MPKADGDVGQKESIVRRHISTFLPWYISSCHISAVASLARHRSPLSDDPDEILLLERPVKCFVITPIKIVPFPSEAPISVVNTVIDAHDGFSRPLQDPIGPNSIGHRKKYAASAGGHASLSGCHANSLASSRPNSIAAGPYPADPAAAPPSILSLAVTGSPAPPFHSRPSPSSTASHSRQSAHGGRRRRAA